eukprot:4574810-Pleurochrysis_carterae.AAC.1
MPGFCEQYLRTETISGTVDTTFQMPISDFRVKVDAIDELPSYTVSGLEMLLYMDNMRRRDAYVLIYNNDDGADSGNSTDPTVARLDESNRVSLQFTYLAKMDFDIVVGLDGNEECDGTPVVEVDKPINITILAFEVYGDATCVSVAPTVVRYQDGLTDSAYSCSGDGDCEVSVDDLVYQNEQRSGYVTTTIPGLQLGYDRQVSVSYLDEGRPTDPTEVVQPVYVIGSRTLGEALSVTVSEGNVLAMLYDPPGGGSYAWLAEGTTVTSSWSFEAITGGGSSMEWSLATGVDVLVDTCTGIGVQLCVQVSETDVKYGSTFGYDVITSSGSTTTGVSSFTLETELSTSDYAGLPGNNSDIILTTALSLRFISLENFFVDRSGDACVISRRESVEWMPALSGHSVKTLWDVQYVEIPKTKKNLDLTLQKLERDEYDDPEERAADVNAVALLNNSLINWEAALALREKRERHEGLIDPDDFFEQIQCLSGAEEPPLPDDYSYTYTAQDDDPPEEAPEDLENYGDETEGGGGQIERVFCRDTTTQHVVLNQDHRNAIFFAGGGASYTMVSTKESEVGVQTAAATEGEAFLGV